MEAKAETQNSRQIKKEKDYGNKISTKTSKWTQYNR